MASLTKMAGAALGSAVLAAIPASAVAVPETEPNNTFPGQSATVGITYDGSLCLNVTPGGCSPLDKIDFFHYTGLPAGGTFDLSFDPGPQLVFSFDFLRAGLYADQTTITSFVDSAGPGLVVDLKGTIPALGELTFGITAPGAFNFEGYTVALSVTPARVPAPAAIVLLAAGLTAVGLNVARRRQRS